MNEKQLRVEVIKSKLSSLTDTLSVMEENLPSDFEGFKESRIIRDGLYKEVEFCIELLLDICAIINKDLVLGLPENEETILSNLQKNKILSSKTITLLTEMKGFRNILVHKYGDVDDEQAYSSIKEGLSDFNAIINEIEFLLNKYSYKR